MTKDSTPLSNSEIQTNVSELISNFEAHLLQDHPDPDMTECKYGEDVIDEILQLIEQVCNESRIDELKQLWNYTQSEIVPEGAKPNDMSDRLHERIKTLTKESES